MKKLLQSKGLVIVLSNSEKKSFVSFLGLYLGSSFLFIAIIAIVYFNNLSNSLLESSKDKMRTYASLLSSKVISAHMNGDTFTYDGDKKYIVGIYSSQLDLLYGEDIDGVDFMKKTYAKDNILFVIDSSAQLHLGIKYIVIGDNHIYQKIEDLKTIILIYTFLSMLVISLIGYLLSRLFLKPIASEREKIDRFIKDTTHELNTPITALLMSVGSLKKDDSLVAKRIELSSNRISSIYENLCYLLKNDLEFNDNKQELLDIKDIVTEQSILLESYAKSKEIEISCEMESFIFKIEYEDATRLINNLLSNALKYSKPKGIVKINLENNSLIISDNGIGIAKENINKITDRFYRSNHSEGGFGIGLDIVASVCKKYEIDLQIDSTIHKGTKVTLLF